jgi:mono/diheme cytochrome c family protein
MPRSPARDLSDRYTGYRGYFRRSDPIRRGKYALAGVAALAVGLWAAADVYRPERAAYAHTHGPLAAAHAHFDDNCAACHVPHGSGEFTAASILAARDRWHDLTCEKCHGGPAHHTSASRPAQDFHARCSNCHHDHGGRANSLVRLSDSHCAKCHGNLGAWHATGQPQFAAKVTNFATDHPEFRTLTQPPTRTLKFSHAVHMNPGQAYQEGGKETMTVARMREIAGPVAAERYRKPGQTDDAPVQLDCASCHQLDSGTGTPGFNALKGALDARGEPPRTGGWRILPGRQLRGPLPGVPPARRAGRYE